MDQDKTEPGALGYHSEDNNGVKFGSILVDPCLQYLGKDPLVSVGQCLSHECCAHLGVLGSTFSIDKNGYAVLWKPGTGKPQQHFGDEYPEWRKATKQREFSRTKKRLRA